MKNVLSFRQKINREKNKGGWKLDLLSKGIAEDKRKYCIFFQLMTPRGQNDRTKHNDSV